MTRLVPNVKCDRCTGNAVKHVHCGLLIEIALADSGRISEMPYLAHHLNLCHSHLATANVTYVHYKEYDLSRSLSAQNIQTEFHNAAKPNEGEPRVTTAGGQIELF